MRQRPVRSLVAMALLAGGLATLASPAGAQEAAQTLTGTLTVVHGLRGLVADVYMDGALALQTFQPERTTDPLQIPAGEHLVEVRVAGAAPTTAPVLSATLTVRADQRLSAVVHLTDTGQPTITLYEDNLAVVPPGQSRVIVRHAAAAPPITVRLNEVPLASGLANQNEAAGQVAAATYQVAVTDAAGAHVLALPQEIPFAEGTANFMYLIGDQAQGTLGWIAKQVTGLQSAPSAVQSGNSGLKASDPRGGDDRGVAVVLGVAVAVAAAGGALLVRGRRRPATVDR